MIEPDEDLRSQFGQYYSFFTESDPNAPAVTTVPYIDYFALGEITQENHLVQTVHEPVTIPCMYFYIVSFNVYIPVNVQSCICTYSISFRVYIPGLVFSICLPVVTSSGDVNTLRGVACIDMTVEDITNEFEYLQRSDHTYIFIIDTSGRTILHPMLPIPGQDFRSDPFFVDIEYFEPRANSEGIIGSMKR